MIWFGTGSPRPVVLSDSATLKFRHFSVEQLIVMTAAAKTVTLPTPIKDLAGKPTWFYNYSSGSCTLSGAFLGGSSTTVLTKTSVLLQVVPVGPNTYKWDAFGITSVVAGIQEVVEDYVGGLFAAGSDTGLTFTYDDAGGAENVAVAYGVVGKIAATGALSTDTAAGVENSASRSDHVHGLAAHTHADSSHGGAVAWASIDKTTSSLADLTTKVHSALTGVGTNTHTQIDTALGTTIPAYFNVTTGHDHDGVDGKLIPIASIESGSEWAAFTSTLVFGSATPTVTKVGRFRQIGKHVEFILDIESADGLGATFTSATLPVTPKDSDIYWPCCATLLVDTTKTNPGFEVDATDNTAGNRILRPIATVSLTNGKAFRISVRGSYEVA